MGSIEMSPTEQGGRSPLDTKNGKVATLSTKCCVVNSDQEPILHLEQADSDGGEIAKVPDSGPSLPIKYDRNGNPLDPQPSADPHDPLNFATWQKWSLMAVLSYWSFIGTMNLIIVVRVKKCDCS